MPEKRLTALEKSMKQNDEMHTAIIDKIEVMMERQIVQGKEIKDFKEWIGNGASDKMAKVAGKILSSKLGEVEKSVEFIRGKIDGHVGTPPPSRKTIALRRLLETGVTTLILGGLFLGGILLFTGRLDIEDVIQILNAWKGNG